MADDQERPGWTQFEDGKPTGKERDIVSARLVIAGLALIAAVIFVVQNDDRVETKFLFFDGTPRLWMVILLSILLGAGLGQVVGVLRRRRRRQDDD
jgi:uncharacterized integral membrane protein